ncbi:MAG: Serine/threonine protein kinase, partial [Marmoricola sp.]|nr:Serine/threonine protein kinase [Marmoricola sp.]
AAAVLVVVLVVSQLGGNGDDPAAQTSGDSPSATKGSKAPSRSTAPKPSPSRTPTASDTPSETPSESPSESPSVETVTIDPAAYVGRREKDARKDLEKLGLTVADTTVDNPGDQEKDVVSGVSPSGEVEPGSTVTLSVYGDPVQVEVPGSSTGPGAADNGKAKGKGKKQP